MTTSASWYGPKNCGCGCGPTPDPDCSFCSTGTLPFAILATSVGSDPNWPDGDWTFIGDEYGSTLCNFVRWDDVAGFDVDITIFFNTADQKIQILESDGVTVSHELVYSDVPIDCCFEDLLIPSITSSSVVTITAVWNTKCHCSLEGTTDYQVTLSGSSILADGAYILTGSNGGYSLEPVAGKRILLTFENFEGVPPEGRHQYNPWEARLLVIDDNVGGVAAGQFTRFLTSLAIDNTDPIDCSNLSLPYDAGLDASSTNTVVAL